MGKQEPHALSSSETAAAALNKTNFIVTPLRRSIQEVEEESKEALNKNGEADIASPFGLHLPERPVSIPNVGTNIDVVIGVVHDMHPVGVAGVLKTDELIGAV